MAVALAVLLCSLTPCVGLDKFFSVSEITIPRRLLPKSDESTDSLLYAMAFGGEKHFIYLERQNFIPSDLRLYVNGHQYTSPQDLQPLKKDCYYQGYVLDSPNSAVTLRTCAGLRGLVELANISYAIEPFHALHGFRHLLHRLDSLGEDDMLFTDNDTDPHSNRTVQEQLSNLHRARPAPAPASQTTRFLELAIFVTKDLFDSFGSSVSTVTDNMVLLVSYLNTRFSPLDIHIFMISLDIWASSDQVDLLNGTTLEKLDRRGIWLLVLAGQTVVASALHEISGFWDSETQGSLYAICISHNNEDAPLIEPPKDVWAELDPKLVRNCEKAGFRKEANFLIEERWKNLSEIQVTVQDNFLLPGSYRIRASIFSNLEIEKVLGSQSNRSDVSRCTDGKWPGKWKRLLASMKCPDPCKKAINKREQYEGLELI
ncbi:hypothetical protein NDU88_005922 [Pleurodeles waltl]|uniref:Peptidase M12B domain-containing protein n=1 Tax=Pleurodeles waltl TaxID=8319 RepID=A0AAV7TWT0_PLEWA|nr:hypothetical protein NDU88_005922 [Pleurodeles waltl]